MLKARARFEAQFDCVGAARRYVRQVLTSWGLDDFEEAASAVVSELASNSVLHARTDFEVTVSFEEGDLRLVVSDESPKEPASKPRSARAITGRGLRLVDAYVDEWGVLPWPGGKGVWCVLHTRKRQQTPSRGLSDSDRSAR